MQTHTPTPTPTQTFIRILLLKLKLAARVAQETNSFGSSQGTHDADDASSMEMPEAPVPESALVRSYAALAAQEAAENAAALVQAPEPANLPIELRALNEV